MITNQYKKQYVGKDEEQFLSLSPTVLPNSHVPNISHSLPPSEADFSHEFSELLKFASSFPHGPDASSSPPSSPPRNPMTSPPSPSPLPPSNYLRTPSQPQFPPSHSSSGSPPSTPRLTVERSRGALKLSGILAPSPGKRKDKKSDRKKEGGEERRGGSRALTSKASQSSLPLFPSFSSPFSASSSSSSTSSKMKASKPNQARSHSPSQSRSQLTSSTFNFASKFPNPFPNDVATEIELAKQLNELVRFSSKVSADNPHLEEHKRRIEEEENTKKKDKEGDKSHRLEKAEGKESEEKDEDTLEFGSFIGGESHRGQSGNDVSFEEKATEGNSTQKTEERFVEMDLESLQSREVEKTLSMKVSDGYLSGYSSKFDESSVMNGDEMSAVVMTEKGEQTEEKEIVELINSDLRNQEELGREMVSLFQFVTSLQGERRRSAPALPFALAPSPSTVAFNSKESRGASPRIPVSAYSSHLLDINDDERDNSVLIRPSRSCKDVRRDNEGDFLSLAITGEDANEQDNHQDNVKKEDSRRWDRRKENRRSSSLKRFSFMELFSKSKSKLMDDEKDRIDSLSLSPSKEFVRSSSPLRPLTFRSSHVDKGSLPHNAHDSHPRSRVSPSPLPPLQDREDANPFEPTLDDAILKSPSLEFLQGVGRPASPPPLSPTHTPRKKGRRTPKHWKSKSSKRVNERDEEDTVDQIALSRQSPLPPSPSSHPKTPRSVKIENDKVVKESKTPKSPRAKLSEISFRVKTPQKRRKTLPTIELAEISEKNEILSLQNDDATVVGKDKAKKKNTKKEAKTPRYFPGKGHADERKEEKKGEKSEGKFSRMLSPLSHIKSPVMSPRKKEPKKVKKGKRDKSKEDIKVNQESFHRLEVENSISMDEIPFLPPLHLLPRSASHQTAMDLDLEIHDDNSKKGVSIPTGLKPRQHREAKKSTQTASENSRSFGDVASHHLVASKSGNLKMRGVEVISRASSPIQEADKFNTHDKSPFGFTHSPLPGQVNINRANPIALQNTERLKMIQSDDATNVRVANHDSSAPLFSPSAPTSTPTSVSPVPFSLDFNKDENQEDTLQKEAKKFSEFMSFLSVLTPPPTEGGFG